MGTRIILAVILIGSCTFAGRSMSNAVRRRAVLLESLISGVELLRIHMSGMLETVDSALQMTGCEAFMSVGAEMRKGISARIAWGNMKDKLVCRGGLLDSLAVSDIEVIDEMFENLGVIGRQAQDIHIHNTLKRLKEQRENARLQQNERERLYVTVGFLMGAILALMVI